MELVQQYMNQDRCHLEQSEEQDPRTDFSSLSAPQNEGMSHHITRLSYGVGEKTFRL